MERWREGRSEVKERGRESGEIKGRKVWRDGEIK